MSRSSLQDNYVIATAEDILRIPDLITAVKILRSWELEATGIQKKEDAVARLMQEWKRRKGADDKNKVMCQL